MRILRKLLKPILWLAAGYVAFCLGWATLLLAFNWSAVQNPVHFFLACALYAPLMLWFFLGI